MPRAYVLEDEELGVLEDKTEALTLNSKRTARARKKQTKKVAKSLGSSNGFLDILSYELVFEILVLLRPSDLFNLQRTSKTFYALIAAEEARIARTVSAWRYQCLEKCFRLPVLLADIDPAIHGALQIPERQDMFVIHKKYQHIEPPNPAEVCTCLTCMLRWSALSLIVDFAYWQDHLDKGEPIPIIPRGKSPEWNQNLLASHARIVRKAMSSPLWHARLLEMHLRSTTRSIRRHAANRGNKRQRFHMTQADVDSGTDAFLLQRGPSTLDFPYHRDNYYLLETFIPNRSWSQDLSRWLYLPADQHDRDIEFVLVWAERRRKAAQEQERAGGEGT
ncbi:hypothetical protein F5Y17DRAFT_346939 [Xylariaceae sp. FL0594]|nr:hypothetical protein F5Y17DRAFT_346939 [Xylariaceae sp. FL0594]